MAAALFRRGPGVCCIHRELCRVVWRPQAALFSSKPPDRKQQPPRRTHIKKAKSQPAVDIAKLLEELFNQRRPATAPPVAQPTKPPTASSVNVSAAASVPPAARSLSGVTVPTTSGSSPTGATPASLSSEAAAVECRTSMETIETGVGTTTEPVELETASRRPLSDHVAEEVAETSSLPAALVEPLIETTVEPAPEKTPSLLETLENRSAVGEGSVETTIEVEADTAALSVQTDGTDSGPVNLSHATEEEPLIETTIESPEASHFTVGTIETRAAAVEGPVEPPIDVTVDVSAQKVETKSTDSGPVNLSHATEEKPLIETTIESPEASHFTVGTIETRAAAVEGPVEPPIDVAAQKVETKSTDSGPVNLSHATEDQPLIETTIEPAVEASPVSEGTIEPAIETESGDNLSHSALIQNAEGSAAWTLKNEPTIESTVESVNVAAEAGGNRSEEEMTLESVTLHVDRVLLASFKTDELLQTKSILDEEADKQVRELSAQTEIGTESSSEDEHEILTEALSKWDSLSEDLREFEGESGALVEELFCHAPPKTPRSLDPPVGERTEEKVESLTLAEAEAEVGDLETRYALEEEADPPAKEEEVEVGTAMDEETSEAEFFTLDSISETVVLQSVTLAEVEASLGTLEKESLSESTNCLEEAAEIVAREQKTTEVEDLVVPPEALSLGGVDELPEDLQIDALMEELLLFSLPASVTVARADALDDDLQASPALKVEEVLLEEEEEEKEEGAQAEALGNEDGQETHADLDPVQRLFLEKIKEYNNMRRLNGGLLEAEPDYEKYLSDETAKLRRLYGGGDLSSFPQFTFTEPQLDQDSK